MMAIINVIFIIVVNIATAIFKIIFKIKFNVTQSKLNNNNVFFRQLKINV
jgi:hypothetical protein